MLAPVVLFVYKRLQHTKTTMESLCNNSLALKSTLYIFSDGMKSKSDEEAVKAVRRYIDQPVWKKYFQEVEIIKAEHNKGLANSVIDGVSYILKKYKKVIVLEDDLLLSPYFLKYMNEALDYYEKIADIWSISGYSFPMKSLKKYPHDIFYSYRGCSWGWATWKDRWEKVDWSVSEYSEFITDKSKVRRFNRGGKDLTGMLSLQMRGGIDSWAIRWCFAESNLNMFTIYPRISYVKNIGCDGTGTHSGASSYYDTEISEEEECKFEVLRIERKIAKEFSKKYTETLWQKVKRHLNKYRWKRAN